MMISEEFWHKIKKVQSIHFRLYATGKGWMIGWIILLLEHTGRKTGSHYCTPLQYELIEDKYYIGAGRGVRADWYRNILSNPEVIFHVGRKTFQGWAEPITDRSIIVSFLKYRLKRHPLMVGMMMKFHRLPMRPSEDQLKVLAESLAIIRLHPTLSDLNKKA